MHSKFLKRFSTGVAILCCLQTLTVVHAAQAKRIQTSSVKPLTISSPNRQIATSFWLTENGAPTYTVARGKQLVLRDSRLGVVRDDGDFSRGLRLVSTSPQERVRDSYQILTSKRRDNTYLANRRVFHLQNMAGTKFDIIFQVSNDGVAFRYFFPEASPTVHQLSEEASSFHFLPNSQGWLQPMSVAKTGWERTFPSYEEFYQQEIPVGNPSPTGVGWVFPALFRSGDNWVLLSESAPSRNYCVSRLRSESPDGEYKIGFPDPREDFQGGAVNPQSQSPWLSPWRLIVVGTLKTVTESNLGVDLADKPAPSTLAALSGSGNKIEPGKASWSWVLLGDGETNYPTTKRFIDYAADMGWRYCLVDALWDTQIGYERMKELATYARTKNVKVLVWYNSAGDWNGTPQTPRNMLLTRESRLREFARLKEMGIAGVKVDFFGGDGQSVVNYYMDILEDAARYGLVVNFHGTTLPRGWQRAYPHLMTAEAIRGEEFITFGQADTDRQPSHAAMLPFTRNIFDPMDFTPVVLDRLPRTQRRTSSTFELALSVLFMSGIQHYAETPEGLAKAPLYVRDFLKSVPSVWEDTRFLAGYPGQYVVLARRSGKRWYLAGINATNAPQSLSLDLKELKIRGTGALISDGGDGNLSFRQTPLALSSKKQLQVVLPPNGGLAAITE